MTSSKPGQDLGEDNKQADESRLSEKRNKGMLQSHQLAAFIQTQNVDVLHWQLMQGLRGLARFTNNSWNQELKSPQPLTVTSTPFYFMYFFLSM